MPKDMEEIIEEKAQRRRLDKRSDASANLMNHYAEHFHEKSEQNRSLKTKYFWLSFIILTVFIVALLTMSIILVAKGAKGGVEIGIIYSSIASAITGLIALPLLIGRYLFPKGEDECLLNYMSHMHHEDSELLAKVSEMSDKETQNFIIEQI